MLTYNERGLASTEGESAPFAREPSDSTCYNFYTGQIGWVGYHIFFHEVWLGHIGCAPWERKVYMRYIILMWKQVGEEWHSTLAWVYCHSYHKKESLDAGEQFGSASSTWYGDVLDWWEYTAQIQEKVRQHLQQSFPFP